MRFFVVPQTNKKMSTIMEIILLDFLMFYQSFLSPQVERSMIISKGVYIKYVGEERGRGAEGFTNFSKKFS